MINDQWKDPGSNVIQDVGELSILCSLLKNWGLPFDIYRLDQQRFDAYHLVGRNGLSRYSTVIWDAPRARMPDDGAELLRTFVRDQGVGLVALSDTAENPVIAELCGLKIHGAYTSADSLTSIGGHFITRGVADVSDGPLPPGKLLRPPWKTPDESTIGGLDVEAVDGASVIARRGSHPAWVVFHPSASGGKAVWIDVDRQTVQLRHQHVRDLFKRTLVWANGYALCAEFPRSVMLFMDDMGASDKTFFPGWHYPTLSQEIIHSDIIVPLQQHHAVLVQDIVPGFVDRRTHRILDPWIQAHVVDELDPSIIHDYTSTKRGLDEGIADGVFEVQSHGWTHMSPDLDSPPGPMWTASPLGLVVKKNWYKEFGDYVRKEEVPAIVQRLHLQRSIQELKDDFGADVLSMVCGGGYGSHSPANNTMRIAADMGFGMGQVDSADYFGPDLSFPLEPVDPRIQWQYDVRLLGSEIPWTVDAPVWVGFHDRDVAMDHGSLARLLNDLGSGVRFMSFAEYCGYLHADVERTAGALRVRYDPHYCAYFLTHGSTWVLLRSDEDRAPGEPERRVFELAPGLGNHAIAP